MKIIYYFLCKYIIRTFSNAEKINKINSKIVIKNNLFLISCLRSHTHDNKQQQQKALCAHKVLKENEKRNPMTNTKNENLLTYVCIYVFYMK